MCDKHGYLNKREAKTALRTIKAIYAEHNDTWRQEQRTYRCSCGMFHLTSQPHNKYDRESVTA